MVFKYDRNIQKILKTKTKPEPWLHIGFVSAHHAQGKERINGMSWAIYIWDTRQVLESGWIATKDLNLDKYFRGFDHALDNKQPLVGADSEDARNVSIRQNWRAC